MATSGPRTGRDHLSLTRGLSGIGEPLIMLTSPGRPTLPKGPPTCTTPSPGRYGYSQNSSKLTMKSLESNSFSFSTVPEPIRQDLVPSLAPRVLGPGTPSASPTATNRRGPTSAAMPMQNSQMLSRALDLAAMYRRQIMELYTRADATEVPVLQADQSIPPKSLYSDLPLVSGESQVADDVPAWLQAVASAQRKVWQEASMQLHCLQQRDMWPGTTASVPQPVPVGGHTQASGHA